jgi:hypothetical protein
MENTKRRDINALLRKLKKDVPPQDESESWLEKSDEQLQEELESAPKTFGEGLPILSVGSKDQERDVVIVKFLEEVPEPKPSPKDPTKMLAYAKAELLRDHKGWDSKEKKQIQLKVGDKVVMNLKRHGGLWMAIQAFKPILGKSLIIGTLGRVKMKKGFGYDYRIKAVE